MRDTVEKILTPVMLPTSVSLAPDYILRMIKCWCENCGSARSSFVSSVITWTVFCMSNGVTNYLNTNNIVLLLCKCHIRIMIRKMTNTEITMLCQQIYNSCTIAISANQQCLYVALLNELIVCVNKIK